MNEKIKIHLEQYCISQGYGVNPESLKEVLVEAFPLYERIGERHRWWNDTFRVVKIRGMFIGFDYADCTGDNSLDDIGWEFDWDTVVEVEEYTEMVVKYRPAKET